MNNFIKQIKLHNPELSIAEIEGILFILKNSEDIKNNDLISLTRLPKETLRLFKKSISEFLAKNKDDSISLNDEGLKVLSECDLKPHTWSLSEELNFSDQDYINKIREIKNKYPGAKIIVISALNENTIKMNDENISADLFITKPFTKEELLSVVNKIV